MSTFFGSGAVKIITLFGLLLGFGWFALGLWYAAFSVLSCAYHLLFHGDSLHPLSLEAVTGFSVSGPP